MEWETVGNDIPRLLPRMGTLQYETDRGFEQPVTLLWSLRAGVSGTTTQLDLASQRGSGYQIDERW